MVSDKRTVDKTENLSSRPKSKRRRRRRRSTESQRDYCLPDDVVFMILVYLPADVIYNVTRFVCRQWYNIIQSSFFISSHLQNSTPNGLLVQEPWKSPFCTTGYFVKPRSGGRGGGVLQVKKLYVESVKKVCASCNGLVFVVGPLKGPTYVDPRETYVANLLTKQYVTLPLFPGKIILSERNRCGFAYAAASRVYKIMQFTTYKPKCFILSLGVDKAWRQVDTSELTSGARELYVDSCLSLRGFVYCVCKSVPFILRFDMETETFGQIHLPPQCPPPPFQTSVSCYYGLLAMETSLCLWWRKPEEKYLFEFWLLKHPQTGDGEWEKLIDINIEGQTRLRPIQYIEPLGWLRSMELLVFGTRGTFVVYNVNTEKVHQTKEMKEMKMRFYTRLHFLAHVDSLVPLHNLSLVMTAGRPM